MLSTSTGLRYWIPENDASELVDIHRTIRPLTNQIRKFTYTWALDNFHWAHPPNTRNYNHTSPYFTNIVNGEIHKWQLYLRLLPPSVEILHDKLQFRLRSQSVFTLESGVRLTVHVTSSDGKEIKRQETQGRFEKLIIQTDTRTREYGFDIVPNDYSFNPELTISFTLICETFYERARESNYDNLPLAMVNDSKGLYATRALAGLKEMEEFYVSGKLSDVSIVAGGVEFRAHKLFLSQRSKVFSRMFTEDMQGLSQNVVRVDDVDPQVMGEVLQFLYGGNVRNIEKFSEKLLAAADKYEIHDLKELCEDELIKDVCLENFQKVFKLADLCKAERLKNHMIEFMAKKVDECSKIMSNHQ